MDFCLQRSAECKGSEADERDCATTSSSINDVLRRKLLQKKTSHSAEVTAKAAPLERLDRWHRDLKSAGFCGELTSLTSKHSPFEDLNHTTISDRVLVLYPSNIHTYDVKTGPFQPVRLVIYVDGAWSLQCPIFKHTVITSGELPTLETSQVIELGKGLVHANHKLCPGLLEDFTSLGYVPENVRVMGGPVRNAHAKSCIRHIPGQNIPSKRESADPPLNCICAECRETR